MMRGALPAAGHAARQVLTLPSDRASFMRLSPQRRTTLMPRQHRLSRGRATFFEAGQAETADTGWARLARLWRLLDLCELRGTVFVVVGVGGRIAI